MRISMNLRDLAFLLWVCSVSDLIGICINNLENGSL